MSKNNTIRKSDKKFIRKEKARIRREFSDLKKQQEMIDALYKRFIKSNVVAVVSEPKQKVKEAKVEKPIGHSPLGHSPTGEAKAETKKPKVSKKVASKK